MLKNYLKIAYRNIKKDGAYSAINVFGLALAIGCCLLILLFIQYQLNFDRHYNQADQIYRITAEVQSETNDETRNMAYVPGFWGPELVNEYPNIKASSRFFKYRADVIVNYKAADKQFFEGNFFWADSSVFQVFEFPLVKGNPLHALNKPNTVVISETIATKYFQSTDPIGKTIEYINGDSVTPLEVTGVMENIPTQTHFHPEFIASVSTIANEWWIQDYDRMDSWSVPFWITYLRFDENIVNEYTEAQINGFLDTKLGADASRFTASLQPINKIHLYSNLVGEFEDNGDINYIYGLGTIALMILLIACINFMNLSTARATKRMKEIGIRKSLGSKRIQLVCQFIGESLIMTIIAFILGIALVELLRPSLIVFTESAISSTYLTSTWFWVSGMTMILIVGFIAGSYPALYLSSFDPIKVLKNHTINSERGTILRKSLVIAQFAISVFLLISTLVISRQLDFLQNKELGFNQEYHITIPLRGQGLQSQFSLLKEKLKESPNVIQVAASSAVLMKANNSSTIYLPDIRSRDNSVNWDFLHVDHDYPETTGIELVAGRLFSRSFSSDSTAAILNESAVKALGLTNEQVLNTRIENGFTGVEGNVVGVAKDFHYTSLHEGIQPFALMVNYEFGVRFINIKVSSENLQQTIEHIREQWNTFSPGTPFSYTFLNEEIAQLYNTEQKQGWLFSNFTILAIIISCLGLFGLASFMAEQRAREIGIRKVLGASVTGIIQLLSKEFLKQVLLGFIIGVPIAWYIMHYWLQEFAFRIQIGMDVIFLAAGLTGAVALITVSWQSIRAALMNPVDSLKSE